MIIGLNQSIGLVLALPAHRSNNAGHQKLGEEAFKLLNEYKSLGENNNENSFNRTIIALIYSAVRAFSVERDRISSEWKMIDDIKTRRERLIEAFRRLSPLEKDNYWTTIIVLLTSIGFSFAKADDFFIPLPQKGAAIFLVLVFSLEVLSKALEFIFANVFERAVPVSKSRAWQNVSLNKYKDITAKFICDYVDAFKNHFPQEKRIESFVVESDKYIKKMADILVAKHFYL